jgi:hypothetical protein
VPCTIFYSLLLFLLSHDQIFSSASCS